MGTGKTICFEFTDFQGDQLETVKVEVELPSDTDLSIVDYMMRVAARDAMKNQFMRLCVKSIGESRIDWDRNDPDDMWNPMHVQIWVRLEKILLEHGAISPVVPDKDDKERPRIRGFI